MPRPKRLVGVSYVGPGQYFLTLCTVKRAPAFLDAALVCQTLAHFRRTASTERFEILAYCFMPDHLHLLVEALGERSDLRHFIKMARQRSGAAYALVHRRRLWQEGYYEHVLRASDDVRPIARYLLENPVRAGLVNDPRVYPFLGSDRWPLEILIGDVDG